MGRNNKVKIEIGGTKYNIVTSEPENYVLTLASELDGHVNDLLAKGSSMSLNNALVLCCLHYIDSYKKSEINADHLRNQVTDYLEDAARTRIDMDEAKRQIEKLNRELNAVKREKEKNK